MEERLKYKYTEVVKKCIKLSDLAKALRRDVDDMAESGTFFGATGENIIDLITEYKIRNGKHPMSSESIRQAFRPDKVNMPNGIYSPAALAAYRRKRDRCESTRADPCGEVFAAKVQIKLYEILPLTSVLTDYEGTILRQRDTVKIIIPPTLFSIARASLFADLVVDNRIAIETNQGLAAEEIASKIALEIMRTHLYTWKAFAARVFQYSEDYLDVIYGVLEEKHKPNIKPNIKPGIVMWGSADFAGNWFPNTKLVMSTREQYKQNVRNGHLCKYCMKAVPACSCGGKP